jgi:tetratricopeptide (TPR) repeat protein
MLKRSMWICFVAGLMGAATMAQTPTPTPVPDCPELEGQPADVRTGYYLGQGLAYFAGNQLRAAENSFTCIIATIDSDSVAAYMNRATVRTASRFYEEAVEDYTEALRRDETLVTALNNRGILYAVLGETEEALADFDAVLSIDADNFGAANNKAVFQAIAGDVPGAISTLEAVIEDSGVADQLADLQDPESEVELEDLEINPEAARAYALLGIMYSKVSLENYRNYLTLQPSGDFRIADAAGSLESRFTFDLRLEDGTWWLAANYDTTAGR